MTKKRGTRRGLLFASEHSPCCWRLRRPFVTARWIFRSTTSHARLLRFFPDNPEPTLNQRIFLELRLPRAALCLLVGASLGVGGTLMQALFRNPIVEPGLVGTSSGAAFGSALYFVLGGVFHFGASLWSLPLAACAGGVLSTYLVFILARSKEDGKASVVMLLLTGLAVNALCMSGMGLLSYIARDPQARSITFWSFGTLSGASWRAVAVVAVSTIGGTAIALRYAKQLNALMIGEEEATYLGVNVNRLKWIILFDQCCHRRRCDRVHRRHQFCRVNRAAHSCE